MNHTLPHRPGFNAARAVHEAEQRFGDVSALECSAGHIETCMAALEIQLKGLTDDKAIAILEETLQQLDEAQGAMRARADQVESGE